MVRFPFRGDTRIQFRRGDFDWQRERPAPALEELVVEGANPTSAFFRNDLDLMRVGGRIQ
jgi:hypothetical protein